MLATPLVLTRLNLGIPLYLYIFVSDVVISAKSIQEKEGEQRPIYFMSKVLQGAKRRYQKIEKAALALVITSRRLRPYFQSYNIIVQTDLPIRQSVQLLEFEISFERREHIKAQALTKFVMELTPVSMLIVEEGEWFLSVDGSSNHTRSGAKIVLEGLNGVLIEQSLHFKFRASNNQAEYETLLVGMRLARELESQEANSKERL
ncbi:hypothetical protein CR513_24366, partial [Mucuna pruriens]